MGLSFEKTKLPGVILVKPQAWSDPRGFFLETYHSEKYRSGGILESFVQDNWSHSVKGVLRGLHFQLKKPQGKLVTALRGEIFDVAVDIRLGSPTFGQHYAAYLSSENKHQLYIPAGFAHGFCVLSEEADVTYKCTSLYDPQDDRGLLWNDSRLMIDWPVKSPELSSKDAGLPPLSRVDESELPKYLATDATLN